MNDLKKEMSFHDIVKKVILRICNVLGFEAREECGGKDWRADVLVFVNGCKYAFEIQTSPQSLKKTLERQEKYIRDDVIGCWLFKNEPYQSTELERLPLFGLSVKENIDEDGVVTWPIMVSLKERKELPLAIFIRDFLLGKIKFCNTLDVQKLEIRFIQMNCWKCGKKNYIYYIGNFISPCNAITFHGDIESWDSEKLIFSPEIKSKVIEYTKAKHLNLATIKERYSKTVGNSYMSFGCSHCDSLFGDHFVSEAILDTWYGDGVIDKMFICREELNIDLRRDLPHWCHSGTNHFCDSTLK